MFNGAKLKYIRMVYGLSRKELAGKLNVTEQAIGQYETGIITPKIDFLLFASTRVVFRRFKQHKKQYL